MDAFASRPFEGNPCAVVHDADGLAEARRTAVVRETGLVECAFLVRSDKADFGARYYLADREIPMAGHPTVATVAALVARGAVDPWRGPTRLTLEVGAGVLPIEVEMAGGLPRVTMTQPAPEFGAEQDAGEIAALYGLEAHDVLGTPQIVSTGTPFCITILRSAAALRRARLDPAGLEAWRAGLAHEHAGLMEPFLVTLGDAGDCLGADTFSRLLLAPPNPPEDPFTGSATGCMAAYLWRHGLIERPAFTAGQGDWMGRPGRAAVEVLGPCAEIEGILVGGTGVVVMSGTLHI